VGQQDVADLKAAVERLEWYHTFEFPGGVVTEGFYDHRRLLHKFPFPKTLAGKRCLDLASSDGLFAFEMARRGGEVWSLDLDDTPQQDWQYEHGHVGRDRTRGVGRARRAFNIARSALGLDVERVNMNIYDVSPQELGQFDFVFMGNILLHLSDPGRALQVARSVTAGSFLSFEIVSLTLSLLKPRTSSAELAAKPQQWWTANLAGHKQLLMGAGFEIVDYRFPLFQRFGPHLQNQPFRLLPPWRCAEPYGQHLAFWLFWRPFGVPSAWALCR